MKKILHYTFAAILILCFAELAFTQDSFEKIETTFRSGQITKQEHALNQAYAQFAPERLPEYFASADHRREKCGFSALMGLHTNKESLTENEIEIFAKVMTRPSNLSLDREYISSNGNFKIHYTTNVGPPSFPSTAWDRVPLEDADSNGIPDYVEETAAAFELSYSIFVDEIGYEPYPSDGDEYDVFLMELGNGSYGYTAPEVDDPETAWYDPSSYIVIDNDFAESLYYTHDLDGMRVTAAHELHHAFQMGYIYRQTDAFFYEMTSTWMEERVYPEINDYFQYLDQLFTNFDHPMNSTFGLHPYGMGIFMNFLSTEYGDGLVMKLWEEMHLRPALETMQSLFVSELSTPFEDIIHKFYTWNYYTDFRSQPNYGYTDAAFFPEVEYTDTLMFNNKGSSIEFPITANFYKEAVLMTGYYFKVFTNFAANLKVTATSPEDEAGLWRGSLFSGTGLNISQTEISFPNEYSGTGEINNTTSASDFGMVVTNAARVHKSGGSYSINLDIELNEANTTMAGNVLLNSKPSPVNFSRISNIIIPFYLEKTSNVDIKIYTLTGRMIRGLGSEPYSIGRHDSVVWDGKTDNGNSVGSGIYICVMKGDGFSDQKKIAVIR